MSSCRGQSVTAGPHLPPVPTNWPVVGGEAAFGGCHTVQNKRLTCPLLTSSSRPGVQPFGGKEVAGTRRSSSPQAPLAGELLSLGEGEGTLWDCRNRSRSNTRLESTSARKPSCRCRC